MKKLIKKLDGFYASRWQLFYREQDPVILINCISAPNVTIASAVVASAAVPGFVSPQHLQMKDPIDGTVRSALPETHDDGSIRHDIPTAGLSEMLNCHFLLPANAIPTSCHSFSIQKEVSVGQVVGQAECKKRVGEEVAYWLLSRCI